MHPGLTLAAHGCHQDTPRGRTLTEHHASDSVDPGATGSFLERLVQRLACMKHVCHHVQNCVRNARHAVSWEGQHACRGDAAHDQNSSV